MKTCEEYVLNELKETKEELERVKFVLAEYKTLTDLVVNGVKDFKIEDDKDYLIVYWQNNFITLELKNNLERIGDLVALIEKGQNILKEIKK